VYMSALAQSSGARPSLCSKAKTNETMADRFVPGGALEDPSGYPVQKERAGTPVSPDPPWQCRAPGRGVPVDGKRAISAKREQKRVVVAHAHKRVRVVYAGCRGEGPV